MHRLRLTFTLLLLVIIVTGVTFNFSMILNMRRLKEPPRKVFKTIESTPISPANPKLHPEKPSEAPSPTASSCVRPEDNAQGLDSVFKRDPEFWGRRPKLVQALKDYADVHKRAISGGEGRVVLSHSWGGMNNRFLPLASALLFGMMTGR